MKNYYVLSVYMLLANIVLAWSLQLPRQPRIIYPQDEEDVNRFRLDRLIRNSPQVLLNRSQLLEPPPGIKH